MSTMKPLQSRVYRAKDKSKEFYCPLCRSLRVVSTKARLSRKNYLQIGITTVVVGIALYPVMEFYGFGFFFLIWAMMELVVRSDFKSQIPCEHCGFDASLYKRNVKEARHKVKEFWNQKSKV